MLHLIGISPKVRHALLIEMRPCTDYTMGKLPFSTKQALKTKHVIFSAFGGFLL